MMPSIRASANPNLRGWNLVQNGVQSAPEKQPNEPEKPYNLKSPYMHASMPLMASTNDALTQFYQDTNPQQRILPAKRPT
jgi:hypothetical protein